MDAQMLIGQLRRWAARVTILVAGLLLTVNYLNSVEPTIYLESTPAAPATPAPPVPAR